MKQLWTGRSLCADRVPQTKRELCIAVRLGRTPTTLLYHMKVFLDAFFAHLTILRASCLFLQCFPAAAFFHMKTTLLSVHTRKKRSCVELSRHAVSLVELKGTQYGKPTAHHRLETSTSSNAIKTHQFVGPFERLRLRSRDPIWCSRAAGGDHTIRQSEIAEKYSEPAPAALCFSYSCALR